jgi:transcriptional regulator with XRE-family HTH domain
MDWKPERHGSLLRHVRNRNGLTRQSLAEELSVTPLSIFNWETGKNKPQPNSKALIEKFGEEAFDPDRSIIEDEGPSALSTWLAGKRAGKKWSRKELAQQAGVTEMRIWNIESGRTLNPPDISPRIPYTQTCSQNGGDRLRQEP